MWKPIMETHSHLRSFRYTKSFSYVVKLYFTTGQQHSNVRDKKLCTDVTDYCPYGDTRWNRHFAFCGIASYDKFRRANIHVLDIWNIDIK